MVGWSTPDLSDITQVLSGLVQTALTASSLAAANIKITCNSPDTARNTDGYCYLSLYLLHVGRDPHWRNTPVSGPRPQYNNAQPLSLNLSYLLTAYCDSDFTLEQRAMSIALQAIHSQPIVNQALIIKESLTEWLPNGEFTLSIEADTIEEMSRLWQAFTVPIRLSALIRAGVVFIAPAAPMPAPMLPPTVANLAVLPAPGPGAIMLPVVAPTLYPGGAMQAAPVPPDAPPAQVAATSQPLIAVAGGSLVVAGYGLDLPAAAQVFLGLPGGTAWLVDPSWRQNDIAPDTLDLIFPGGYATPGAMPLTAMPLPGLYTLSVGVGAVRSNAIPILVAPLVLVANPPVLAPDGGGLYTVTGAGFVLGTTTLAFGNVALAATNAAPADGEFAVTATTIIFKPPGATAAGAYPVLIAVNGIAASTGWVVVIP